MLIGTSGRKWKRDERKRMYVREREKRAVHISQVIIKAVLALILQSIVTDSIIVCTVAHWHITYYSLKTVWMHGWTDVQNTRCKKLFWWNNDAYGCAHFKIFAKANRDQCEETVSRINAMTVIFF